MDEEIDMIYFTSDMHLGHEAIIHMCNRPFKNAEEMNRALIRNINSMVQKNDTVYLLKLNGHKIRIRGNHDKKYDKSLFEGIYDFLELKGYCSTSISLMHYPMLEWSISRHGSIHLHGHQHNRFEYNIQMKEQGIKRYDVGIDGKYWKETNDINDYFPVSLNQILEFMEVEK